MGIVLKEIEERVSEAVAFYWQTLDSQSRKQKRKRLTDADRGGRSKVTGGKQMDGFTRLVKQILTDNGMPEAHILMDRMLEVPGFFRPTKKWDLIVVHDRKLIAAMELKSQTGPSFGNNLNNRVEEAVGTAQDLKTAFREGAFNTSVKPWLGTLMLLEDCEGSRAPVAIREPHFRVFPEFKNTSYAKRYELLLRKLVLESLYDRAALVLATQAGGRNGRYTEPAPDLRIRNLFAGLAGHIGTVMGGRA